MRHDMFYAVRRMVLLFYALYLSPILSELQFCCQSRGIFSPTRQHGGSEAGAREDEALPVIAPCPGERLPPAQRGVPQWWRDYARYSCPGSCEDRYRRHGNILKGTNAFVPSVGGLKVVLRVEKEGEPCGTDRPLCPKTSWQSLT